MQTLSQPFNINTLPIFQPTECNGFANQATWYRFNVAVTAKGKMTVTGPDNIPSIYSLAAAMSDDVPLCDLPPNAFINAVRIKSSVISAGATTMTGTVGVTGADTFFISTVYDLMAAITATNFAQGDLTVPDPVGNNTTAAIGLVVGLISTVANLDQLTAGVFDVWIQLALLP